MGQFQIPSEPGIHDMGRIVLSAEWLRGYVKLSCVFYQDLFIFSSYRLLKNLEDD